MLSLLPAGGIQDGTMISVEDFTQDLEIEIIVNHLPLTDAADDKENTEKFVINGQASTKRKSTLIEDNNDEPDLKKAKVDNNDKSSDDDDDDVVFIV
jgi:hypothetical protein